MNFLHQPLTWAFLLIAVPLLIHLINMMRHKRVQWAAMEFLLASYKKHRKWIWMKQLLLLLMRMAAIAAVVAIMAQWVPPDRWAKLFGGKVTHHYVLLDDSFSMADQASGETAFDRAKGVVAGIIERAAAQESQHKITVLRYSRATADASNQNISDAKWREEFSAASVVMAPSQLSVGPEAAMKLIDGVLADESDESRIVYVVSDFRKRDWDNPSTIDQYLQSWEKAGADVNLVDCVKTQRPNLAVTQVAPTEGTRSAGVPLFVNVTVKNFGPVSAEGVDLTVTSYAYPALNPALHGDDPAAIKPEVLDRRSETIESLAAAEEATLSVQVRFPNSGKHVVEATLPEDAIVLDNARYCVVDFPQGEPVLIVDGHEANRHAYYLMSVFQPRSQAGADEGRAAALTGIIPTVGEPVDLNTMTPDELGNYRAIYLLDVARLDDVAIRKLEAYVEAGGGLALFLGDNVNPTHYREKLYDEGRGLLPMPLAKLELLTLGDLDDDERLPDFEAEDHPVLKVFNHPETGPLFRRGVMIGTYYLTPGDWTPPAGDATTVVARLRDKAKTPFVVEKKFGHGRVIVVNTTVAPLWNNWKGEASFPATMLLLHGHIAAPLRENPSRLVGAQVENQFDASTFKKDAQFIVPGATPIKRKPVAAQAMAIGASGDETNSDEDAEAFSLSLGGQSGNVSSTAPTQEQGIYEIWAARKTGELELDRFAFNVDSEEGELARLSSAQLAEKLDAKVSYHAAGDSQITSSGESTSHLSEIILYLLIALLIGEQLLAYSASYHPGRGASPAATAAGSSLRRAAR